VEGMLQFAETAAFTRKWFGLGLDDNDLIVLQVNLSDRQKQDVARLIRAFETELAEERR